MSANPKSDLVTKLRADVGALNTMMDAFVAHRAEYIARNADFVIGDLVGANATAGFAANDADQMVIDMNTIVTAIRSGGTIAVGVWTNCVKIL